MDLFQLLTAWETEINRSKGAVGLLEALGVRDPKSLAQIASSRFEREVFQATANRALVQAQLSKAFRELSRRVTEVRRGGSVR